MKKSFLAFTIVSAIGLLIFFGCSKEVNQTPEKQDNVFQPTEKDLQIESKILAFKQKIEFAKENIGFKSGDDDLSLDEAVWNIEALANYTYADASSEFDSYVGKKAEIEFPLTNGKVTLEDAGDVYDLVIDSLTAHYNEVEGDNKHLVLADISLKETDGETATFNVTSEVGKGAPNPFAGFGVNDYWWFGYSDANSGGYCAGPNFGTYKNSDAAEQIERKIMMRKSLPVGHSYFIDINEVFVKGESLSLEFEPNSTDPIICECCYITNPNDPITNDNYYDKLVFYNWDGFQNFHGCLSPDEMNFYLDGMEEIIYNMAFDCFPDELSGKIFSDCNMSYGMNNQNEILSYFHKNTIHYGISVGSGDPPDDL